MENSFESQLAQKNLRCVAIGGAVVTARSGTVVGGRVLQASHGLKQTACDLIPIPDNKVHGANMGPIWGRQDPGGPHVGPMDLAIWDDTNW